MQAHSPTPAEWCYSVHNMPKFFSFFLFGHKTLLKTKKKKKFLDFEMQKYSNDFWSMRLPWSFVEIVSRPADRRKGQAGCLLHGRRRRSGISLLGSKAPPRQHQSFVSSFHQPTSIAELAAAHAVCDHTCVVLKKRCDAQLTFFWGMIDMPGSKLGSSFNRLSDCGIASRQKSRWLLSHEAV